MITLPIPSVLDSATLAGAESAHHLATVIDTQWQAFWLRDTATVMAEIEGDLQKTLAIFALNSQAAQAVNALLDAVNDARFPRRAPDAMPAGWAFDGSQFTYQPPNQEPT
jgi:hypothetical protein